MKKNIKQDSGFTIIEVLIVLAIAGLIMAVVLLAVPGLQRSQANSAARTDASHISTSVSSWSANNNGAVPAALGDMYDIYQNVGSLSKFTDTNASSTATAAGNSAGNAWQTISGTTFSGQYGGWYLGTGVTTVSQFTQTNPAVWAVLIDTGINCATNPESGATVKLNVGNTNNIAILYTTETSGQPDWNCLQAQ